MINSLFTKKKNFIYKIKKINNKYLNFNVLKLVMAIVSQLVNY